jgi:VWFA-related protein
MPLLMTGRKKRWLGASCCVALFWLGAPGGGTAQQAAPQVGIPLTQAPTLTVTTREVLMDVVVTDASGRPVPGLTASDFKVTEERKPQTIRRLVEHEPMPASDLARLAAPPKLPPNTFTNYTPVENTNASTVILLDAMDTPVAVQMRLREQVIGYLKHMQPGASLAIFQLDTEMHLIQGFSSDPKALLAAAESKRDMPSMARPFYGHGETNELTRMQILRDGMQTMGRYLAGFPGRKNLIWFTAQVPASLFYGGLGSPFRDEFGVMTGMSPADQEELTGVLTVSRVAVYPVDTRGVQGLGMFDASHGSAPTGNYANRYGDRQSLNYANLDMVASVTGGKAYYNTNDMKQVIAQVVADGESYYTLDYATTNTQWKGQLRHVKITVDRPGVKLQCRPGYYAIDRDRQEQNQIAALKRGAAQAPSDAMAETVARVAPTGHGKNGFAAAMDLGAVPPTEIVFTASLRASDATEKVEKRAPLPESNFLRPEWRNKPYRSYTIQFHTDAGGISLARGAGGRRQGRVEFVAIVYDQQAAVVNTLEKTAFLDLDEAGYRRLLAEGMALTEKIAVPAKGNYFLRLGVRDVDGDHMGALEIPVDQVKMGLAGS